MARLALAAREPGEHLVREEDLDQIPIQRQNLKRVLRSAGLLAPSRHFEPSIFTRRPRATITQRWTPAGDGLRSCEHCLSWSGTRAALCIGCSSWIKNRELHHGVCRRCRREFPLKNELCRFCNLVRAENPLEDDPVDQLWFGLPGLSLALNPRTTPGRFNRGRARHAKQRLAADQRAAQKLSEHLVDPDQPELIETLRRDWSRVLAAPWPALTDQARQLLDELEQQARRDRWFPGSRQSNRYTLRLLLSWLGAAAPIHEADVLAVSVLGTNHGGLRVVQFLDARNMLIPAESRIDSDQAAVDRLVSSLPAHLVPEVESWIKVLRGQGCRPSPTKDWQLVRRYLSGSAPILRGWGNQVESLRSITAEDVRKALQADPRNTHYPLTALRSLFRALRRERLIFQDPTRHLILSNPGRLPNPVPLDKLHGLIDGIDNPATKLILVLFAVHALLVIEVVSLKLDDLDLARGRLVVRRRDGQIHQVFLDEFTHMLISTWLRERVHRWPASTNPYLIVSQITATDVRNPPVSKSFITYKVSSRGLTPGALRTDRILDEAQHTQDPVHLMRVFGISGSTAMRYLHAACPERFTGDPTSP